MVDYVYDNMDKYSKDIQTITISYSQPNTFFRLDGRRNIHAAYIWGVSTGAGTLKKLVKAGFSDHNRISEFAIGLTQDVALLKNERWYFGSGVGPYVKQYKDDWGSGRFMFGIRAFTGYSFGSFNVEFILNHFSNGHTTELNKGLNSMGLGLVYSF